MKARLPILLLLLLLLTACGQKQGPEPAETAAPSSASEAPPVSGPFMQSQVTGPVEEGKVRPLKLKGLNSVEELNRCLAKFSDAESKQLFEDAFRMTFTTEQSSRNYAQAEAKFNRLLERNARSAESYRGLGYALFNQGDSMGAVRSYLRAVEIDPNYGEAHYALAIMYSAVDIEKGRKHFRKALELGIPDERKLGERVYK